MALPANGKQNGGNDGRADQGTRTSHRQDAKGIFSVDALDVGGGLVFLVFSGVFHVSGGWFHIAGFFFDFLVVLCGLTIITHHVDKKHFRLFGLRYWLALMLTFGIFSALAVHVVLKENANSTPPNSDESRPMLATELDDKIRRVFLIFWLSETNEFESLCPIEGSIDLDVRSEMKWSTLDFTFKDSEFRGYGFKNRAVAYDLTLKFNDVQTMQQTIIFKKHQTSVVSMPIPVWSVKEAPLKTIRDFKDVGFRLNVSSNLFSKIKCVELVVNGWALFHHETTPQNWNFDAGRFSLLAINGDEAHRPVMGFMLTFNNSTTNFYPKLSSPLAIDDEAIFLTVKPTEPASKQMLNWEP